MTNVILLTLDATRKDVFGLYGNTRNLTPTFDGLQRDSLVFTKAQSTGPYTQASFPGLLTSSYFLDYGQPKGLPPQRTLISEPLRKAGIVTAAFHSNPYLCAFLGWNRGWDVFYDSMADEVESRIPYIRGKVVNRKAINWLSAHCERDKKKPFFLWLHYMDVHEPYMPDDEYVRLVDPSLTLSQDEMYRLFKEVLLKRKVDDPAQVELLKRLYDVHVREIDGYFRDLLSTLERLDIVGETVLIITSDHGDEFNEHGGLSHDDKFYRELIDIPLLICNSPEKGTCNKVVSNVDIPPTILACFGLEAEAAFQGQSLLPQSGYIEKGVHGEALDQRSKKGGDLERDSYFYRLGENKIIYRAYDDIWEMYDLDDDPQERLNIVGSSAEARSLQEIVRARVRRWNT
jgi:arylsulfatase A-like enzyme